MDANKRIIVNTIAQYGKSIFNILLSLYSTRLVLEALNINDYGIYSVVGGVVGILGYLTNSLVVTTQRYLSYYQGANDKERTKLFFANSLFIHVVIGLAFCIIMLGAKDFFVNHFLNIDTRRLDAAEYVYFATVMMMLVTVITAPFKAFLIAKENIVYISLIEVIDGVLKLLLAMSLFVIGWDRLEFYASGMITVLLINLLAYIIYTFCKFDDSHFPFAKSTLSVPYIKQLLGFAGWTTYGMVAGMCQTQGFAVVLNKFFGTAMNAAFGIGSQVNGAIRFVSTSILNAMNPQIMQAEGNQDRRKMLDLAAKESKFSTALMLLVSIPLIIEMPFILRFWLKTVPDNTCLFCRALMLAFLFDQTTLGLHAANQATGHIKIYSIIMFTPKILIVPMAWAFLKLGISVEWVMAVYVAIELIVAICRLPYLKVTTGLHIGKYLSTVIVPLFPLVLTEGIVCLGITYLLDFRYRFIVTIMVAALVGLATLFMFSLNKNEKEFILRIIRKRRH